MPNKLKINKWIVVLILLTSSGICAYLVDLTQKDSTIAIWLGVLSVTLFVASVIYSIEGK